MGRGCQRGPLAAHRLPFRAGPTLPAGASAAHRRGAAGRHQLLRGWRTPLQAQQPGGSGQFGWSARRVALAARTCPSREVRLARSHGQRDFVLGAISSTRSEAWGLVAAYLLPVPLHLGVDNKGAVHNLSRILANKVNLTRKPRGTRNNGDVWGTLHELVCQRGASSTRCRNAKGHATAQMVHDGRCKTRGATARRTRRSTEAMLLAATAGGRSLSCMRKGPTPTPGWSSASSGSRPTS